MNDELCHYGILGMKWGIRRYQNYDGSYTKLGLKRRNDADSGYVSAKKSLKNAKSDGGDVRSARDAVKSAKQEVKDSKRFLKDSVQADRGRELTQEGYTIRELRGDRRSNMPYGMGVGAGIGLGGGVAGMFMTGIAALPIAAVVAGTAAGGTFVARHYNNKIDQINQYRKRLSRDEQRDGD